MYLLLRHSLILMPIIWLCVVTNPQLVKQNESGDFQETLLTLPSRQSKSKDKTTHLFDHSEMQRKKKMSLRVPRPLQYEPENVLTYNTATVQLKKTRRGSGRTAYNGYASDISDSTTVQSKLTGSLADSDKELNYVNGTDNLLGNSEDIKTIMGKVGSSHGDTFPCPPCSCSYTANRFVKANCTGRNLWLVPLSLPPNTLVLNLSLNNFRSLNLTTFHHYPLLEEVSLALNYRLMAIWKGPNLNQTSKIKKFNLTYCDIQNIENNSFSVFPELSELSIRVNKLQHLTQFMFAGLNKLQHLDLAINRINTIELGTFDNLTNLKILDLSRNGNLSYSNKTFSPDLFKTLTQLRKLHIEGNSVKKDKEYPNSVLQQLTNLEELSIDGLENFAEFGPEMKSLKNLVHLKILVKCAIKSITETFFENIPYLKSFLMEGCVNFNYVHPKAYTHLKHLENLTISRMKNYSIDNAFEALAGFNNSNLKSISYTKLRRPDFQCNYLGHRHSKYLKNIKLESLDLSANRIALIGTDFLKEVPKSLKRLILRNNIFTSSTQSLSQYSVLTGLRELDLSKQNVDTYFTSTEESEIDEQKFDCPEKISPGTNYKENRSHSCRASEDITIDDTLSIEINAKTVDDDHESIQRPKFKLPPNLRILKASEYNTFGMQVLSHRLPRNISLTEIDFSNSFLSSWGFQRMPPGIIKANLANNYCSKIKFSFFLPDNSHQQLIINNNFLGPSFANDDQGSIFAELENVRYLDISTNLIFRLHKRFFKGLKNVKYLKMTDNRLTSLNTSFVYMKSLQFIDLSRNSIRWIEADVRNDLDEIASTPGHGLELDLTMNPLPCTCDGLELIAWMATTKVRFTNEHLLQCESDKMKTVFVGNLEERKSALQRQCMSKTVLIVGSVAAMTLVLVTVGLGLMYRYRWKIRYLYNTAMAAMFGFDPDHIPKTKCTFDAYFVYTKETQLFVLRTCLTELEKKRGHRLCVEDRDFLLGTYMTSNIVSAIRNSTKTVVVLNPDFYNSVYSEYSFQMAVMEELYKQRSVLHLLLYKPIPNDEMSHDELKIMERGSYTEFPPEEEADDNIRQKFWDELSQVIGHTGNNELPPVLNI